MQTQLATIRPSQVHRYGVFVDEPVKAGVDLGVGLIRLPDADDKRMFIRSELGRFINHSDAPTAKLVRNGDDWHFYTTQPLAARSEVTSNYELDNMRIRLHDASPYTFHYGGYLRDNVYVAEKHGGGGESGRGDEHIPTIALDFDTTLVDSGPDLAVRGVRPGAAELARKLFAEGWRIIVFSVRGDCRPIREAMAKFDIPYHTINYNPDQPEDGSGKVLADCYIDDRAINGLDLTDGYERLSRFLIHREQKK